MTEEAVCVLTDSDRAVRRLRSVPSYDVAAQYTRIGCGVQVVQRGNVAPSADGAVSLAGETVSVCAGQDSASGDVRAEARDDA